MNNSKLCALVVAVCIIAPCLVGYVWPTDQGTTTNHVIGNAVNIDADVNNATIPYYEYYTDLYNNNTFVFHNAYINPKSWDNAPVTTTTRNTGLPAYTTGTSHTDYHTTNAGGMVTYFMSQWKTLYPTATAILFDLPDDAIGLYAGTDGGTPPGVWLDAKRVIYYADSNLMYVETTDNELIQVDQGDAPRLAMTYEYSAGLTSYSYTYQVYPSTSGKKYVQLEDGFIVPGHWTGYGSMAIWYNGYENRGIDILLKGSENPHADYGSSVVIGNTNMMMIRNSSNIMQIQIVEDGTTTKLDLATYGIYDYYLLHIDADRRLIEFSGLRGMSSFLDDYTNKISQTVSYTWKYPTTFNSMNVINSYYEEWQWLIPRTVSSIATVQGIEDKTIDLRAYNASNAMYDLRNVVYGGSSIDLNLNGNHAIGTVSGNSVSFDVLPGQSFRLSDLSISYIDKSIYVNGQAALTVTAPVTTASMTLNGQWLANVYYHPITDEVVSSYGWQIGGFGLDVAGFCAVGLCTSAGSGLAAMLYGHRSGAKVFLVLLTSLICGVVYLAVLMDGLS